MRHSRRQREVCDFADGGRQEEKSVDGDDVIDSSFTQVEATLPKKLKAADASLKQALEEHSKAAKAAADALAAASLADTAAALEMIKAEAAAAAAAAAAKLDSSAAEAASGLEKERKRIEAMEMEVRASPRGSDPRAIPSIHLSIHLLEGSTACPTREREAASRRSVAVRLSHQWRLML
jgi:hypothetical protein